MSGGRHADQPQPVRPHKQWAARELLRRDTPVADFLESVRETRPFRLTMINTLAPPRFPCKDHMDRSPKDAFIGCACGPRNTEMEGKK